MSVKATPKVGVIYTRISSDPEGRAVGVERQEKDCRDLAERLGITVLTVYVDNDRGASRHSRKSRPEWDRMIAAIEAGEVEVVIAYSASRLTRRVSDYVLLTDLTAETGVEFRTVVSGEIDLKNADGTLLATILAATDQAEADRISERVRNQRAAARLKGHSIPNGLRPFGWAKDQKTLDPTESEALRKAIRDVLHGVPLRVVVGEWNEKGITTSTGKTWETRNLRAILVKPRLWGAMTYQKEIVRDEQGVPIMGDWEPITDETTWTAIQGILTGTARPKKTYAAHLLSGFLRCGECGRPMYGAHRAKPPSIYQCSAPSGHSLKVSEPRVDEVVTAAVAAALDLLAETTEILEDEALNAWPRESELVAARERHADIARDFALGEIPKQVATTMLTAVGDLVEKLGVEKATWAAENYVGQKPKMSSAEFSALSMGRQRVVIEELVESITVAKGVKGQRFDPNRLTINWRE